MCYASAVITRRALIFGTLFAPLLRLFGKPPAPFVPYTGPSLLIRGPAPPPIDYAAIQRQFRESAEWTQRILNEQTRLYFGEHFDTPFHVEQER